MLILVVEMSWTAVDEVPKKIPGEQAGNVLQSIVRRSFHYQQTVQMESPALLKTLSEPLETIAAALDDALSWVQVKSPAVAETMPKVPANSKAHDWY